MAWTLIAVSEVAGSNWTSCGLQSLLNVCSDSKNFCLVFPQSLYRIVYLGAKVPGWFSSVPEELTKSQLTAVAVVTEGRVCEVDGFNTHITQTLASEGAQTFTILASRLLCSHSRPYTSCFLP